MNPIMIQAFVDEVAKLAAAAPQAGILRRNIRPMAWMAAGAGAHSVGQDAVNDYRTGRMIRRQNEANS